MCEINALGDIFGRLREEMERRRSYQINYNEKTLKFKTFINKIYEETKISSHLLLTKSTFMESLPLSGLIHIYDYTKLNDYGKIIMNHEIFYQESNIHKYVELYNVMKNNSETKYNKLKTFIEELIYFDRYKYEFIFWALMILTVHKTDAEKHLSVICDIAKMLNISDDEMKDITYIIKIVYNKNDSNYHLKCEKVKETFNGVLNMFK